MYAVTFRDCDCTVPSDGVGVLEEVDCCRALTEADFGGVCLAAELNVVSVKARIAKIRWESLPCIQSLTDSFFITVS